MTHGWSSIRRGVHGFWNEVRAGWSIWLLLAIHPFTGYLAFVPSGKAFPINLPVEDAIKMEFSAGLFRPAPGWLSPLPAPSVPHPKGVE
jgi:uncharacterized membrane protein